MATDRLLSEVKAGDLPRISAGNFTWTTVEQHFAPKAGAPAAPAAAVAVNANAAQAPIPAKQMMAQLGTPPTEIALTDKAFPLNLLEGKTFAGTGYNTVWRPRSQVKELEPGVTGTEPDVLELNLTAETMAFSKALGNIPNRGVLNEDIELQGLSYVQRVGAFENPDTGSNDRKPPAGIHFEPGVFLFVPATKDPKQPSTLNRMASIPHGTTINAQGVAPQTRVLAEAPKDFASQIPPTNITPFRMENGKKKLINFNQMAFPGSENDRLPPHFGKFTGANGKGGKAITEQILANPNQVLRNAVADQEIESFVTFDLTTEPGKDFLGGGTTNIGFLQGTADQASHLQSNAHAVTMTVTYWIEKVRSDLDVKPQQDKEQIFEIVSAAGVLGPTFVVPPTTKITSPIKKRVTWTQIQYSQNVTLNFNTLSWPHISVATLGDTSRIPVSLS